MQKFNDFCILTPSRLFSLITLITTLLVSPMLAAQTLIDVWDTTDPDPNNWTLVATIQSIRSAETGAEHYDFFSASAHPVCVALSEDSSNLWIHEDSRDGTLSFGFVFAIEDTNSSGANTALLDFRIVDSTTNPIVVISDDPGEAVETPAGSNAFKGTFNYNNVNTDGIAVSPLAGGIWTIIIDSVNFGSVSEWIAASGGVSSGVSCSDDLPDFELTLDSEYRLTPNGNPPSGAPVDATVLAAVAGPDQTVDENTAVQLDGSNSSPLGDISFSWTQTAGGNVSLSGANTVNPDFIAPDGPDVLTFELIVSRNSIDSDPDYVNVSVLDVNDPPSCDSASASTASLWPPNHKFSSINIDGLSDDSTDADNIVVIVTSVTSDEDSNGKGDGNTSADAAINVGDPQDSVSLRAERSGKGNGRVYQINFAAFDGDGESCTGSVQVTVPHNKKSAAIDDGQNFLLLAVEEES